MEAIYFNIRTSCCLAMLSLFFSERIGEMYDKLQFFRAVDLLTAGLRQTHSFYQYHTPWKYINSTDSEEKKIQETTLHVTYESLRIIGILLQPLVPQLSDKLLTRLGVPVNERKKSDAVLSQKMVGRQLGTESGQLFKRLDK